MGVARAVSTCITREAISISMCYGKEIWTSIDVKYKVGRCAWLHVGSLRTHYYDLPNFIKIGWTVAEIWRFNGFQNGGRPPSCICEIIIFKWSERLRDPFCTIEPNFVKIGETIAEISRFLWLFKMAAAAILVFYRARIGTTHEDYLVVFIVVLNLVGIAAVLSIIWKF